MLFRIRRTVSSLALAAGAGFLLAQAPTGPAAAKDDPPTLPALQVVVLVDESGSLRPEDVAKEKEAARTIAFSVLAPQSVVSVVGFGSSDGPGQSAVDVVCEPTVLTGPQKRDQLAICIDDLQRREPGQGDDTDHFAALRQALSFVRAEGPDKKLVFLLTDGKLDVPDSPAYGDTAERRNTAAAAGVRKVLGDLEDSGVQVWPMGFGNVDQAALKNFARGESCTPAALNPQARITGSSAELVAAVAQAFSSASCVAIPPPGPPREIPANGSTDLTVDMPGIASDASIVVYKNDPRVQVSYLAPGEERPVPASGTGPGGSRFEFAGQTTETESMRVSDPQPGRWTIRLASPGKAVPNVSATVVYQAAVKAVLTVSPPQPKAGQTVDVDMQVWARSRAITDAEALRSLTFVASASGSDVAAQRAELTDPDRDGTYSGKLTMPPDASGNLVFSGQVTGIGIGGDNRTADSRIQSAGQAVQAQILFDQNKATVVPGGAVTGTIALTNDSGKPARLRLLVAEPSDNAALTVEPAVVEAGTGVSNTAFTLRVGAAGPLGTNAATLRLVDDADPEAIVAERLFAANVRPLPTIWEKLRWLWIGLAVVLLAALAFLLMKLRARNGARKVRGLTVQLYSGGFVSSELEPRDRNSRVFRFVLQRDFTGLHLQPAGTGDSSVYEMRRDGARITVTTPEGRALAPMASGDRRSIGKDLALGVVDGRAGGDPGPADIGPGDVIGNPFGRSTADGAGQVYRPDATTALVDDPFGGPETTTQNYTGLADHDGRPDPYGPDPYGGVPFGAGVPRRDATSRDDDTFVDPNNPFR